MTDHHCLSGKRCVSRTADGAAVIAKAESLCGGCVRDIQKCADELPHYLLALRDFKGHKPQSVGQSKVSGGATEGSSPLNVAVFDLCCHIEAVAVAVGGYRIRDLVTLPGGVDTALEVRALHSRADAIVGLGRVWERRRAVRCPECNLPSLGQWLGEETIYCTNSTCAITLTKSEYEERCEFESKKGKRGRGDNND